MRILVTGANGFIGQHLCEYLHKNSIDHIGIVRKNPSKIINTNLIEKDINPATDWTDVLQNVDTIVHLAGLAHLDIKANTDYDKYAEVNVHSTKNLAEQAAKMNVQKLIFISSIGVNGNQSDYAYDELMQPDPQEDYALSKKNAEDELRLISNKTNLKVVIIRPPLVYGKEVKANFKKLMKFSQLKLPLPFGAIHNQRSLIYVENLINFMITCIVNPKADNETFLVTDDEDVSTKFLIKSLAKGMGKKAMLFPVPNVIIKAIFYAIGQKKLYFKLFGNLFADISKAKNLLGWKPPFTFNEGIVKTVERNKS